MSDRTVADVMTRNMIAVSPDTSLATVAETLARHKISGVPVVDSTGKAVGVVTAADLVNPNRQAADEKGIPVIYFIEDGWAAPSIEGADVGPGRAKDVMTPLAFTVEASRPVTEAAEVMVEQRIHRLLAVEGGNLVGIVSSLDLLRAFVENPS